MLGVEVRSEQSVRLPCLIDTGSLRTRMPAWVAEELDIKLDDVPSENIGLGGSVTSAHAVDVAITTVAGTFPTTVWFCRGWHSDFGLLGQEGFLERYRLTLDVNEGWFALQPH